MKRVLFWLLLILVFIGGCKKGGSSNRAGTQKGGVIGFLKPSNPTVSTGVIASYRAPSNTKLKWIVNGRVLKGVESDTLDSHYIEPYDTVEAYLELPDGKEIKIGQVVITNRAPVILDVKILPENPRHGDDISISAEVNEPDNQEVTLYVKWYINDKMVKQGEILPGSFIKAGDKISCEIVASDGYIESAPVKIIAPWVVQNSPPVIKSGKGVWKNKRFIMPLTVEDPDGHKVNLKVVNGPPGLTLRNDTIFYQLEKDTVFSFPVEILADDGIGGKTTLKFQLEVKRKQY